MIVVTPSYEQFACRFGAGSNQVVCRRLAADLDTPVSLFLKVTQARSFSFLLESVTGGEVRGRYSIIGLEPDLLWTCSDGRASVSRRDGSGQFKDLPEGADPFTSLRTLLAESRIELPEDLPSSSAGLFGYLGYDMVRLVEHLPDMNVDQLGTPDSILMRPSIVIVLDWVKGEVIVVSPAWADAYCSARQAYDAAVGRVDDAVRRINLMMDHDRLLAADSTTKVEAPVVAEIAKEAFLKIVRRAKEYISAGDVFQVVLSQRWTRRFELPPFSFYRALRRTNPSPFMFFFNFRKFQVVGASPEILVRVFDREITIRPIAGTRPRGVTLREDEQLARDLLVDEKECAEHLMLLDLGRNDVGRVSRVGTVRPTEQFQIERYSHVMHIVSNVVGELMVNHDALSALLSGLPAGTVSGAPKVRAMEIIDELERSKRGVYAGGVGYFSVNGDMDMCIALRTAVIQDGVLYIQAGGGIVYDSDPEAEWTETVNKSQALRKAASDAELFAAAGNEAAESGH